MTLEQNEKAYKYLLKLLKLKRAGFRTVLDMVARHKIPKEYLLNLFKEIEELGNFIYELNPHEPAAKPIINEYILEEINEATSYIT